MQRHVAAVEGRLFYIIFLIGALDATSRCLAAAAVVAAAAVAAASVVAAAIVAAAAQNKKNQNDTAAVGVTEEIH